MRTLAKAYGDLAEGWAAAASADSNEAVDDVTNLEAGGEDGGGAKPTNEARSMAEAAAKAAVAREDSKLLHIIKAFVVPSTSASSASSSAASTTEGSTAPSRDGRHRSSGVSSETLEVVSANFGRVLWAGSAPALPLDQVWSPL
jgi:hypothetical protein